MMTTLIVELPPAPGEVGEKGGGYRSNAYLRKCLVKEDELSQ